MLGNGGVVTSHVQYHAPSGEHPKSASGNPLTRCRKRNAGSQLAPATSRVLGVSGMPYNGGVWQVNATAVFKDWFDQGLNHAQRQAVRVVVDLLAERGTELGRPYADRVHGSMYHNMKELRPRGSRYRATSGSCSSSTGNGRRFCCWEATRQGNGRFGTAGRSQKRNGCTRST